MSTVNFESGRHDRLASVGQAQQNSPARLKSEVCLCCNILCKIHPLRLALIFASIGVLTALMPLGHSPTQVMTPLYREVPLLFQP